MIIVGVAMTRTMIMMITKECNDRSLKKNEKALEEW